MAELAFRAYPEQSNIVVVAFPADDRGGPAVLRRTVPFSAVGLASTGASPSQYDMPFGTFSVSRRQDLVRGGLELVVDYEGERIELIPHTQHGKLESKAVRYRFEDFGVEDQRESPIQLAKDQVTIRIQADKKPVSDDTWP